MEWAIFLLSIILNAAGIVGLCAIVLWIGIEILGVWLSHRASKLHLYGNRGSDRFIALRWARIASWIPSALPDFWASRIEGRASVEHSLKRYAAAIKHYTKAAQRLSADSPTLRGIYHGRARVYWDQGKYDRAAADHSFTIAKNSAEVTQERGHRMLSHCFESRGEFYAAIGYPLAALVDFDKAIELDPTAFNYMTRGDLFRHHRDYRRAISDYNAALAEEPDWVMCLLWRGDCYRLLGDGEQARTDYHAALAMIPKFPFAMHRLGWIAATFADERFRNGREALAIAELLQDSPAKGTGIWMVLAAAHAECGNFDLAVSYQQQAVAQFAVYRPIDNSPFVERTMKACSECFQRGQPYREEIPPSILRE